MSETLSGTCPVCGASWTHEYRGTGQRPMYCGRTCAQRMSHERRKARRAPAFTGRPEHDAAYVPLIAILPARPWFGGVVK